MPVDDLLIGERKILCEAFLTPRRKTALPSAGGRIRKKQNSFCWRERAYALQFSSSARSETVMCKTSSRSTARAPGDHGSPETVAGEAVASEVMLDRHGTAKCARQR